MRFGFHKDPLPELAVDLLGLAAFEDSLDEVKALSELDQALQGLLRELTAQEEFRGRAEDELLLHTHGRLKAGRILLLGLGKRGDFDLPDSRRYGARVAEAARKHRCKSVGVILPPVDASAFERTSQFVAEGMLLGSYRFDRYLSEEARAKGQQTIKQVQVLLPNGGPSGLPLARAEVVAQAVCFARDLINEPAAEMTPRRLADAAKALAKDAEMDSVVLGAKDCEKQGMRLLLAVGQGSDNEVRFVHLTYRPKGRERPRRRYVLVGKGITFDSGGLSLKPSESMLQMKADMAGAATVLGVMKALPALGVQAEVHALIPAAENMVSGGSYRLGDVYVGMNGKSVEIANTDAEGRLALADALAYGVKLNPDEMIDVATLTGACMVALGPHMAGVMGSDWALVERFLGAARRAGEEVWQLPLPNNLKEQLKSEVAELKNVGERWGGALTAGLFLKEFVAGVPWLHLDVAGPAIAEKDRDHIKKGGTGFGVACLLEYLLSRDGPG